MSSTKFQSLFTSVCARLSFQALCVVTFASLFLFASSASSETIMTVQHNNGYTGNATSVAVAFNSNVTSGNLLLVAVSTYDGVTLDTPTDTLNNTFVQLVTKGTTGESVAAIYAAIANGSGADTVTCGVSASNNIHCHIYEVQGVTTTVDQDGKFFSDQRIAVRVHQSATTNAS